MARQAMVTNVDDARRAFGHLASAEPWERSTERMRAAFTETFAITEELAPIDEGDYRREPGALKASGRVETGSEGDEFHGKIAFGTEDDELPYAQWVIVRNWRKGEESFMQPAEDILPEEIERSLDAPFIESFGHERIR